MPVTSVNGRMNELNSRGFGVDAAIVRNCPALPEVGRAATMSECLQQFNERQLWIHVV